MKLTPADLPEGLRLHSGLVCDDLAHAFDRACEELKHSEPEPVDWFVAGVLAMASVLNGYNRETQREVLGALWTDPDEEWDG